MNEIIMIDNETSKFCRHSVKRNVLLRYVMKCYRRLDRVHVLRSVLEANNALQQPHIFIFLKEYLILYLFRQQTEFRYTTPNSSLFA